MESSDQTYPSKHLIVMTSTGRVDLAASKVALKSLAEDPEFLSDYEVLLDWRDIHCTMSVMDVFELATYLANPKTELPTHKKIAILVSGKAAFDHANFLELCSVNRGVHLHAFEDYDTASRWLETNLPDDPREQPAPSTPATDVRGGKRRYEYTFMTEPSFPMP